MSDNDSKNNKNDKRFTSIELDENTSAETDIVAQILMDLKKTQDMRVKKVVQLALDNDPIKSENSFASIYRRRNNLIPNDILKRIRDSEELVGGVILPVRAKQLSLFARPRANRFDIGFTISIKSEIMNKISPEEQQKIKDNIVPKLRDLLLTCGRQDSLSDKEKRTFSQTIMEIAEDYLTFGAFATEIRRDKFKEFHSFRAVDAGTIYFTTPQKGESTEAEHVRQASEKLLQTMQGLNVDIPKFQEDAYTYVQVIDSVPRQVFTDKELIYWSGVPSTDINRSGYPVSPLERIISSITTHINLTTHNKMYFVNGRAARNIMVFKSENLEEDDIASIKAQMVAHINSSNAAWRMPVFGIGEKDEVNIMPMDPGNRDMEFQYLSDLNKRMIFAAFQMSPDEVAALSYLSKGTNSQSLAEANNEWKLIAARDTGLRPLLLSMEDFFNTRLLPLMNPEWSKLVQINFEGLDADSPEKEATRLQQDSALFLTMNDMMERVEKEDVPVGGDFPLNAAYLQLIEKYFTKGQILKAFGGKQYENADKDPSLQYYMGDPAWFQFIGMQQQQAQMQQQGGQGGQQQSGPGGEDLSQGEDLDSAISQLGESLGKSESNLPVARKELLKRHKLARKKIMDSFSKDSKELMSSIMAALSGKDTDDHEH